MNPLDTFFLDQARAKELDDPTAALCVFITKESEIGLNSFVAVEVLLKVEDYNDNLPTYEQVFKQYIDGNIEHLRKDAEPYEGESCNIKHSNNCYHYHQ